MAGALPIHLVDKSIKKYKELRVKQEKKKGGEPNKRKEEKMRAVV